MTSQKGKKAKVQKNKREMVALANNNAGCLINCCWFCRCFALIPTLTQSLWTCLMSERSRRRPTALCRWTAPAPVHTDGRCHASEKGNAQWPCKRPFISYLLSCCTGTPRCCTLLASCRRFSEPAGSSLRPSRHHSTAYARSGREDGDAAHSEIVQQKHKVRASLNLLTPFPKMICKSFVCHV